MLYWHVDKYSCKQRYVTVTYVTRFLLRSFKKKRILGQLPPTQWNTLSAHLRPSHSRSSSRSSSGSSSSTTSTEKITQISGLFPWIKHHWQLNEFFLLFCCSYLLRGSFLTCLTTTSLPSVKRHAHCPRSRKWSYQTSAPSPENLSMMKSTCLMKRLVTPNHASLKCSPLYSLISVHPDATPQQVLGLEPVFRELDNSGHSVRQSLMMMILIITVVIVMMIINSCGGGGDGGGGSDGGIGGGVGGGAGRELYEGCC